MYRPGKIYDKLHVNSKAQSIQIAHKLIDRKDDSINLCECKFYNSEFAVTKEYASKLRNRKQEFIESTKTKKTVFNTLLTNYGAVKNEHYLDVIDVELMVNDLMR